MVRLNALFCKGCEYLQKLVVDHDLCKCGECDVEEIANVKQGWLTERDSGVIAYRCQDCIYHKSHWPEKLLNKRKHQNMQDETLLRRVLGFMYNLRDECAGG